MQLKIIGSSSSGNGYIMQGNNESLVIEAGVKLSELKQAMNFDMTSIHSCIISHAHGDHFKYVKDYMAAGINCYSSTGTMQGIDSHRAFRIKSFSTITIGEFKVKCFDVKHDCREPYGYLIQHPESGNTLFITDSFYTQYKFPNLNNIILEANYCEDELNKRLYNGKIEGFLYKRITESHMSIQTAERLLLANDLSQVHNIILIHLSNANSDEKKFKERIENVTGKTVTIADKGQSINLNKEPF